MSSTIIKRHRFKNGLQLLYQPSAQAIPITHLYVFCKVGSAYEQDPIRGASHFVEHMCFKGTEKVKKVKNLLVQYNQMGAEFNAYTSQQHTAYYIKCDDQFFENACHSLSDVLLHSTFPKKEFDKEQHVVIEEQIRKEDNPLAELDDQLNHIYYAGSSYAERVDDITYHPSPTHLKHKDMIAWYKWFYVPSNMIVSIISNLPFSTILKTVSSSELAQPVQMEADFPKDALSTPILALRPISGIHYHFHHKKGISSNIISIGFRTCGHDSKDRYPLQMLKAILSGFTGRLFTEFRTKRGLTYRSSSIMDEHEHTGYFSFFLQTDPQKLLAVLSILLELMMDLKWNGVSDEEIHRAKGLLKGDHLLSMQSMDTFALYNGIESIYTEEDFTPYQDLYTKNLSRITKKQVVDTIHKYFQRDNMVVVILYNKEIPKKEVEEICERFH